MAAPHQAANAEPYCEPAFVRMNAELVHATVACNKNYMDTPLGVNIMELAHACFATLGLAKAKAIMHTALLNWEQVAKERGKKEACAETDNMFNIIKAAVYPKN
jgi:hypothetical protein